MNHGTHGLVQGGWLAMLAWVALTGHCLAHSTPDEEGIHHFGKVDGRIYRGETPTEKTFQSLHRLGVKSIIDLRMVSRKGARAAALVAREHGLLYTNLPLPGLGRPRVEKVQRVLDFIKGSHDPVYLFCRRGCDRTGLVIACYRIDHDHWTNEAALREADKFGLSRFERGMRMCIRAFGSELPVMPRRRIPSCLVKAAEQQREDLLADMAMPTRQQHRDEGNAKAATLTRVQ